MNSAPYGASFIPPRPGVPPPGFFARPGLPGYVPGMPPPLHFPPGSLPPMRPPLIPGGPPAAAPVVLPKPTGGPSKSAGLPPKQTTLYVGKIAPTVDDATIKMLMETCGPIKSWKRLQDAETKQPKGFGFCEYEEAEGVLAAMRLLNNLKLDGQELLLKMNTPTQKYVEEHQAQQEREAKLRQITSSAAKSAGPGEKAGDTGSEPSPAEPEPVSEESKDTARLEAIMAIVSERATHGMDRKPAANASEFFNSMQQPAESDSRFHRSAKREPASRTSDDAAAQLDKQLARERDRERREEDQRMLMEERMYKDRLRDWERHERFMPGLAGHLLTV